MSLTLVAILLASCAGSGSLKTSMNPSTGLEITTTALETASVGSNYSFVLSASGGTPPYVWSISTSLPAGFQLNPATGRISGAATTSGSFPVVARVRDSSVASYFRSFSLVVSAPSAPAISAVSPVTGTISGGTTVVVSGNNFSSGAVIQFGHNAAIATQVLSASQIQAVTPSGETGTVSVSVRDANGQIATAPSAFTFVAPPLQITTSSLPIASKGASYSETIQASGGSPPYSWKIIGGSLASGLQLNSSTGAIVGTSNQSGYFSFTVQVQDASEAISSAKLALSISQDPAPRISSVSPTSGPVEGGTSVVINGSNFRSGVSVRFGAQSAASAVLAESGNQIVAVAPSGPAGTVGVSVSDSDGQMASAANAFTFIEPAESPVADVVVDASQTISETGGDDLAAAKNINASASAPESDGGLYPDWKLISSQFPMKRMRNINGLGDCALNGNGSLTGCSRLNGDLGNMKMAGLTPHVVVGQWAPGSIQGDPKHWGSSQWSQYDALCYAIVNYVVNEYKGAGFPEALFEVENEIDTTTDPRDLWLTTSSNVGQGDPSRFTQFDTVYKHWASAVDKVARQTPNKRVRIAGPSTGFWTVFYGSGQLWHNQLIKEYAQQHVRLDVVSLHVYGGWASEVAKYAQSIRTALNENGYSNTEIWITEWGASDTNSKLGQINATHQGAAWSVSFLLQALKGGVTGGSFLIVRDNQGHDTIGSAASMNAASWNHVQNGTEYPKAIANAMSMVARMSGMRKATSINSGDPNLYALASSDSSSASLIVANYNYVWNDPATKIADYSKPQSITVAFKNLPFKGPVTIDRYLIDAQTSNLNYWISADKLPPSVQASQLQKVESFSATVEGGAISLQARQLGQSAVSFWVVHQ